jgi:hypothetical protein
VSDDPLDPALRDVLFADAAAVPLDIDLSGAFRRRLRRRALTATALALAGVVALAAGAVAWRAGTRDDVTTVARAGDRHVAVALPDGRAVTVGLPPRGAGAPAPRVRTFAAVRLVGCCPHADVGFDPTAVPLDGTAVGSSWRTPSGLRLRLYRLPGGVSAIAGHVGSYRMRIVVLGTHLDPAAAEAATRGLAVTTGAGGYPMLAAESRTGARVGATIDLGAGQPLLSLVPAPCHDPTTRADPSADSPTARRCFPGTGMEAYVQGLSAGDDQAAINRFADGLRLEGARGRAAY